MRIRGMPKQPPSPWANRFQHHGHDVRLYSDAPFEPLVQEGRLRFVSFGIDELY
jgi:hypothetical protein